MKTFTLYKPKDRPLKLTGAKWKKLRAKQLATEPLCEACLAWGEIEPATDVDHINNDATDNSMDNLMSLCHSCHSKKTGQESKGVPVTIYGIGDDGYPLEPKSETFRQRKKSRGTDSHLPPPPSHARDRKIGDL